MRGKYRTQGSALSVQTGVGCIGISVSAHCPVLSDSQSQGPALGCCPYKATDCEEDKCLWFCCHPCGQGAGRGGGGL